MNHATYKTDNLKLTRQLRRQNDCTIGLHCCICLYLPNVCEVLSSALCLMRFYSSWKVAWFSGCTESNLHLTFSVCPTPKCVQKYHEVITFQELTDCLPTLMEELIKWHNVQVACPVGVSSEVVGNMKVVAIHEQTHQSICALKTQNNWRCCSEEQSNTVDCSNAFS